MGQALCRFLSSTSGWITTFVVAAVAAYALWYHTNHVIAALPFLLLLACPLMHLFGHGGHGHGGHGHAEDDHAHDTQRRAF